jgi:hypothetical protein
MKMAAGRMPAPRLPLGHCMVTAKVATLPDFLERRFNRGCRDVLSVVSLFSAIVIHMGVALYTAAWVLRGILGLPPGATLMGVDALMLFIVVLGLLTGVYTMVGGLLAVVWTESVQTVLLLIGWEELLCTGLFMGADGGTLSSAGVVPEVVMSLYQNARAGNWDKAKHIQFELLDLFSLMVNAPNFPEGFRTGYELRGFHAGHTRFPLSPAEHGLIAEMRSKLACALAGCGFDEAAVECRSGKAPMNVEAIVQAVLRNIQAH